MRHGSTPAALALILTLAGAAIASSADEPPLPDSRLGLRTAPLLLLSRPDVRSDLKMTAEQSESAARAIRSMYVHAHKLSGKGNSPEAARERRAVDDEAFAWIETRLSPEQQARLVQVDLQWEGASALVSRPMVTKALNLSTEQILSLRSAIALRNELRVKGQAEAEANLTKSALATLSESQRETWRRMLGDPIPFHAMAAAEAAKSVKK